MSLYFSLVITCYYSSLTIFSYPVIQHYIVCRYIAYLSVIIIVYNLLNAGYAIYLQWFTGSVPT